MSSFEQRNEEKKEEKKSFYPADEISLFRDFKNLSMNQVMG